MDGYLHHAHHHGQLQVPNGLLGTLFVGQVALPAGRTIGGDAIPADLPEWSATFMRHLRAGSPDG